VSEALNPPGGYTREQISAVLNRAADQVADPAEFEHRAPYPDGYEGLIPRAAGSFSDGTIDGLRIYVPVRRVLG
jgi:hypothetical protein